MNLFNHIELKRAQVLPAIDLTIITCFLNLLQPSSVIHGKQNSLLSTTFLTILDHVKHLKLSSPSARIKNG